MISKARIYEAPKVVVLYLVPYNQLLSTSNQEKVDFLKSWIDTRFTWLYVNINAL